MVGLLLTHLDALRACAYAGFTTYNHDLCVLCVLEKKTRANHTGLKRGLGKDEAGFIVCENITSRPSAVTRRPGTGLRARAGATEPKTRRRPRATARVFYTELGVLG